MSKYPLKAWAGPEWQRKLSKTVTVSRVDEDIPTERQKRDRKPWFIALTQNPDLLTKVGGVRGLPAGNTLLLSEYDVVALVRYLLEPQMVAWFENPSAESGEQEGLLFLQPGMVGIFESGEVFNGEAEWSPEYFKHQQPLDPDMKTRPARKVHTLPWKRRGKPIAT